MQPAPEGFLVGLSLIVAIGAQNAFVLRAGLRRQFPFVVALVSTLGDAALISLGALGLGGLLAANEGLRTLATFGGAAFLAWYGVKALRSALRPGELRLASDSGPTTPVAAALTAAGFSLLNPHAILDTVVLLGSVSARHVGLARLEFAFGAVLASGLWFFGLAFGAAWLTPLFARPAAWRVLDLFVAAVMFALALGLLLRA